MLPLAPGTVEIPDFSDSNIAFALPTEKDCEFSSSKTVSKKEMTHSSRVTACLSGTLIIMKGCGIKM